MRTSILIILALAFTACTSSPNDPGPYNGPTYYHEDNAWEFPAPFPCQAGDILVVFNAPDVAYDGSYVVRATYQLAYGWFEVDTVTGAKPEGSIEGADVQCVTPPPPVPPTTPACVPEGLVPGDTFEVVACRDGLTAACSIVEAAGGGNGTVAPLWGCTYGGLTCVQGCER